MQLMDDFSLAFTDKQTTSQAAEELTSKTASQSKELSDSLNILFSNLKYEPQNLLSELNKTERLLKFTGINCQEIINSKNYHSNSTLLKIPQKYIPSQSASIELGGSNEKKLGEEFAQKFNKAQFNKQLLFLFCPNTNHGLQEFIRGIQEVLGKSFPITGIIPNLEDSKKSKVLFGQNANSNTVCGILFGSSSKLSYDLSHGWKPLGQLSKITRSEKNVIYEINEKPAIDIYHHYFGDQLLDWNKSYFKKITYLYPLGIPFFDEHVIRSGLIPGENGSLICQGEAPQDSEIRIMISTKFFSLEAAKDLTNKIIETLLPGKINFILLFSSIARYNLLGRKHSEEIEAIQQLAGSEVPIIGCRTIAEIAPLKSAQLLGEPYIHNNSMLMIAAGE